MLPVDKVMRWQGDCSENASLPGLPVSLLQLFIRPTWQDKGLVLCERITVPADGALLAVLCCGHVLTAACSSNDF